VAHSISVLHPVRRQAAQVGREGISVQPECAPSHARLELRKSPQHQGRREKVAGGPGQL
jgi:hypothetical protein